MARFINSLEPGATSDFFFDSGASTHVTADINNLFTPSVYTGTEKIHMGNNTGL
jgi:hypothetical protein